MVVRTLRAAVSDADAERFVGRTAELAAVDEVLSAESPSRILFVHGPGGIGKSALLRAAGRSADAAGFDVVRIDARTLPSELEQAAGVIVAGGGDACCIVIDEVDNLGSSLGPLRDRLLDRLPDSARLVFAGRRGPGPSWREAGLDRVVVSLRLGPLADGAARQLLARHGIADAADGRVASIVAWAQGSPLALTVAASAPAGRSQGQGSVELEERLTAWLAGHPMLDVPRDVLEVAALARTLDARLLAAALPGRATRDGFRRLSALPVVERVGEAVALHAVLAASVRARLRATEPRRESALMRRIAEHLAARARLGDMGILLRLSQLLETPELRTAIGNDPSDIYYADALRDGELAAFGRTNGFDTGPDWPEIVGWMRRWPEQTLLIRHIDGRAVMLASFLPVGSLAGAGTGAVATSLTTAGRRTDADATRSFAGIVMFADGPPQDAAESARLGSGAFMLQRGVGDMQSMLIHYPSPDRRPPVPPAIAREVEGELTRPVAISDFRPAGAVGTVEAMVLSEHGFVPRPTDPAVALLDDDDDPERIAQLTARLDEVFGATPSEQRLRRAIELIHLGRRATEEECLTALNVSRRTWFRLLRTARERISRA